MSPVAEKAPEVRGEGSPPAEEADGTVRLLLIDDDPAEALRLRYDLQLIEGVTFEVTHAPGIDDGLQCIEDSAFDVVLLDLGLPEGDGPGILARTRVAFNSVPVIVMAREGQQSAGLEAVRLGAQGYLVKGRYTMRDLVETIRQAVARHAKVSELHQARQREHYRATHDVLTGLYNRSALEDFLKHCLAQAERNRAKVAVLFMDLDRFKQINDTFGHEVGDQLLKMVAERITVVTRKSNMAARLGGDEFVMLLQDVTEDHIPARVAQILIGMLSTPFVIDGTEHEIGASIGIAGYPQDARDPAELIRRADTAMYHAKAKGRNGFHFYTEGMDELAERQLEIEAALRSARSKGELRLHYQPIVDIRDQRVVGLGALLRWQRGSQLLNAADFIPLAERIGVIDDIGAWVLQEACVTVSRLDLGGPFRVFIKASRGQLDDRRFADSVTRTLRMTGVSADRLGIEVRQGCALRDSPTALGTLRNLRRLGLTVTIEDFAAGCSSLTDLKHQPVDALKLGRRLVEAAIEDAYDRSLIVTACQLAQLLNVEVIATGVETAAQRDLLAGLDCHKMQGNLFARPVDETLLPELLDRLREARPVMV